MKLKLTVAVFLLLYVSLHYGYKSISPYHRRLGLTRICSNADDSVGSTNQCLVDSNTSDTIMQVLDKNKQYSTFRTLLTALPDLLETLQQPADLMLDDTIYTVFVPNNAAFAKLEKDILFKLGKKDNLPVLRKIVRFHFVEDVLATSDISIGMQIDTLALLSMSVKPKGGGILGLGKGDGFVLNEGSIVSPDIQCCNGVIHEVDSLLNPYLLYRYLV